MKTSLSSKQLLLFLCFCLTTSTFAQKVIVSGCSLNGWQEQTQNGAGISFVNGPATPPLGNGSLEFSIPDVDQGDCNTNGRAFLTITEPYKSMPLSSIQQLSYWTYIKDYVDRQAPALHIIIDNNNDGDANDPQDDRLVFEPVYQTGTYLGLPPQNGGTVHLNVWEKWDAYQGGWWTAHDPVPFGPPTTTLPQYAAAHPNAEIVAIVLSAGGGGCSWAHFLGYVDALKIDVNGMAATTYDFEPKVQEKVLKVLVCHKGRTISIPLSALIAHLKHGDFIGSCRNGQAIVANKGASEIQMRIPAAYQLNTYPNPFTGTTKIQYSLPQSSTVSVKVYDVNGKLIATLYNGVRNAGVYTTDFNAANLSKGVYYTVLQAWAAKKVFTQTQKIVLMK